MGLKVIMRDTREKPSNEGWRTIAGTKGLGIDSMNAMMTPLGCSKQGQLDGAATQ